MPVKEMQFSSRLILGLGVIALGVLFMLENLGLVDARQALRFWPVLLILYGLTRIVGMGCRQSRGWGILLTVMGVWFLLHNLGLLNRSILDLWLVLLIVVGFSILRRPRGMWGVAYVSRAGRSKRGAGEAGSEGAAGMAGESPLPPPGQSPGGTAAEGSPPLDDSDFFKADVLMASVTRKITSQRFRGGEVVAIMGGGDLDLRSARMAEGVARLELNLLMGGINLFVPEDWIVEIRGTPLLGGVDDQSRRPVGPPAGRLIVSGVVLMSSVTVKN